MSWLKRLAWTKMLTWVLAFLVVGSLLFPLFPVSQTNLFILWLTPVAHAESNPFTDLLERIGLYNPPRGKTAPTGRSSGGAGRGPICALLKNEQNSQYQQTQQLSKNVMALVPFKQVKGQATGNEGATLQNEGAALITTELDTELVGGLTTEARPTFWFYLPYISTSGTSPNRVAQFVLLDESEHPVWNELMTVELLDNPRLVEYPMAYTLEIGKLYSWYFSVICDSDKLSRNPVVRGWIQRVEPTEELQTALKNAPRFEQYVTYAENGIWFESVNSLVKIRRQFPSVNRDAWTSLLDYFKVPDDQLYLKSAVPTVREVVNGNQLPAKM